MSKTLIIGGGGFLGSNLAEHLILAGRPVRVLDRQGALSSLPASLRAQLEWMEGDFTRADHLAEALAGVANVVHLASTTIPQTSNDDPIEDIENNLVGAVRMMEAARAAKIRRVIFGSSGGTVYGPPRTTPISEDHPTEPVCSYGIVKLAIEKYFALFQAEHGLDYVSLRIANPYGPYQRPNAAQGAVGVFVSRALAGHAIEIWGDGRVIRDFIHVSDVCRAMIAAIDADAVPAVLNVGSGKGHSLNDLIAAIEASLGKKIVVNYRPGRRVDVPVNILDTRRIKLALGWAPQIAFDEGVRMMIEP